MPIKAATLISFLSITSLWAQSPVLTYHNDVYRTGWYHTETTLTPSVVNSTTFGKLFILPADGKVDAQPLYVPQLTINGVKHNVVFVATENDTIYAYDADTLGSPLWQVTMLATGETPSDDRNCGQVSPQIGVTATPAISLTVGTHGTMYAAAMSKDSSGNYHQRLHALDITSGAEEFGGPVDVQATYPGTGDGSSNGNVIFNPAQYKERPGLLLTNGVVITTWSSHCDIQPYTGWVISYNQKTLAQVSVLDFTPNGQEGCVWQSGDGPAVDTEGNIYFLAANGTFDTTLNSSGFPINGDYGNAFMKLSNTGNKLAVADYFTMSNTVSESNADEDLGSGGAMLLPPLKDASGTVRQLAVGAGKDTNIYVVDRTNMGKFNASSNNIYQEIPGAVVGGEWAMPAYYYGRIYYGGVGDYIRTWVFQNGLFTAGPVTSNQFPYPGATPAVSSNGTSTPILWATANTSPAVLYAYYATNVARELYDSNQAGTRDQFGNGNKFITPVIANGKVYVGTTNGVGVFGLLKQGAQAPANAGEMRTVPETVRAAK
jgi:hypothetical protein